MMVTLFLHAAVLNHMLHITSSARGKLQPALYVCILVCLYFARYQFASLELNERPWVMGKQIAVKRLKVWSTKAEMEFAVEVEILGRVRHKNLLSLKGYCAEGQERLIVYDYMPKLSLLSHLHGQFSSESTLDWQQRMKIAIGSAEGLA
jgi:uncharacterized protein (DUF2249 family)